MNDSRIYRNMKIAWNNSAVKLGCSDWCDLQLNATKGYQSMLLVVLSKGGRCYFWSLFDCDDRRSPWWASCVGPQHDADMISISFNSYASLAVFGTTDCVTTDTQSYLKKFEEISYVVRLYFSPLLYSARHLFLDFFLVSFRLHIRPRGSKW